MQTVTEKAPVTSPRLEKLVTLLKELFQLDQPDLDFGIYRIMHAKSAEVAQFLEKDLLPQVQTAFAQYRPAEKAALQQELAELKAGIEKAGMDAEQSPKVQELKVRIASEAVDIAALEGEVFDHLYSFFRRYYHEGDFLSKRVYKPGVYAVPYEGEEVKLHWANADQYYIKTSEYLRDYAFRLRPRDDTRPMRVHFRLTDAAEGEHNNVKANNGKDRVFILATDDFIAEEETPDGKELVIRFEYRPATLTDWPEEQRQGKTKPPTQKDLRDIAHARVLATPGNAMKKWVEELSKPHLKADGSQADYSRLHAHLERYTARNTFDYFIHKDLGGFLRRELDFYIKNEVMHLDDIENESAPRVEQYLSKIKVIRSIAGKIIAFLAQLEDFQKKLWLKKKFVVETQYLITLKEIPEEFYEEIAKNDAQREEWVRLFAINETQPNLVHPGFSEPLSIEFLRAHPTLVVDTQYFPDGFKGRLLQEMSRLDEMTCGLLVCSENAQALRLLIGKLGKRVHVVYTDPPYNTGSDEFLYKDTYRHSSWVAMMNERMALARDFLKDDGICSFYIDENEHANASLLLSHLFGESNRVGDIVWRNSSKNDQSFVSMQHEYLVGAVRNKTANQGRWTELKEGLEEIYSAFEGFRKRHGTDWKKIHEAALEWYRQFPPSNPIHDLKHYSWMDERGVYFASDISGPNFGQYRYEVMHPITGKPCKEPASGWRFPPETMEKRAAAGLVHFGDDETTIPNNKTYLKETEEQSLTSIKYRDGRVASKLLASMFGGKAFSNPKDVDLSVRFLKSYGAPNELVLDPFAGTGTTAHAFVNLLREDRAPRGVIQVEMGDHFDSVLVPRIKKVIFTPEWRDGRPARMATPEEVERSPRIMKVIRLESYEDTLNNLEVRRTGPQKDLLAFAEAQDPGGFVEQYLLEYMLDVETRGSPSLLNIERFMDPTSYKLKVKRPGSDESRELNVDLLETFNWLIGLDVDHIAAPRHFTAAFKRAEDPDLPEKNPRRLLLDGPLKQEAAGKWWFRAVTGRTRDGRKTLVIWRNRPGGEDAKGIEQDTLVLESWFIKQGYSTKDNEFDLIYVNGDNTLENLKQPDDTWKVRLIEEDFHRLMFDAREA